MYLAPADAARLRALPTSQRTALLDQWGHAVLTDVQHAVIPPPPGVQVHGWIISLSYQEVAPGPLITQPGVNVFVHVAGRLTCYEEVPQDLSDTHTAFETRPWVRWYYFAEVTYWPDPPYAQQTALTCDQWPGPSQ